MTRATPPRQSRLAPRAPALALLALLLAPTLAHAAEEGLVLVPRLDLLGALILLFVLLIFPVNQLLFKPLFRVLDAREEKIDGTRARARKLENDAEAILQRYERSVRETREEAERERRTLLEEVRAESQRQTAQARSEAEGTLTRARGDVSAALEEARATLRDGSRDLARQAASQVLGRAL